MTVGEMTRGRNDRLPTKVLRLWENSMRYNKVSWRRPRAPNRRGHARMANESVGQQTLRPSSPMKIAQFRKNEYQLSRRPVSNYRTSLCIPLSLCMTKHNCSGSIMNVNDPLLLITNAPLWWLRRPDKSNGGRSNKVSSNSSITRI